MAVLEEPVTKTKCITMIATPLSIVNEREFTIRVLERGIILELLIVLPVAREVISLRLISGRQEEVDGEAYKA